MFAVMCVAQFLMNRFLPERANEDYFLTGNLAIYFGVFLVVGFLWAGANWYVSEKRFKDYEEGRNG